MRKYLLFLTILLICGCTDVNPFLAAGVMFRENALVYANEYGIWLYDFSDETNSKIYDSGSINDTIISQVEYNIYDDRIYFILEKRNPHSMSLFSCTLDGTDLNEVYSFETLRHAPHDCLAIDPYSNRLYMLIFGFIELDSIDIVCLDLNTNEVVHAKDQNDLSFASVYDMDFFDGKLFLNYTYESNSLYYVVADKELSFIEEYFMNTRSHDIRIDTNRFAFNKKSKDLFTSGTYYYNNDGDNYKIIMGLSAPNDYDNYELPTSNSVLDITVNSLTNDIYLLQYDPTVFMSPVEIVRYNTDSGEYETLFEVISGFTSITTLF